jgi:hypothetical protein
MIRLSMTDLLPCNLSRTNSECLADLISWWTISKNESFQFFFSLSDIDCVLTRVPSDDDAVSLLILNTLQNMGELTPMVTSIYCIPIHDR